MEFRSKAVPSPSIGKDFTGVKDITVPNQSMSLREILERFSRQERLPIEKPVSYFDSEHDLEKIRHLDLVDRADFISRMKAVKAQYEYEQQLFKQLQDERDKQKTIANITGASSGDGSPKSEG